MYISIVISIFVVQCISQVDTNYNNLYRYNIELPPDEVQARTETTVVCRGTANSTHPHPPSPLTLTLTPLTLTLTPLTLKSKSIAQKMHCNEITFLIYVSQL